MGFHYFHFECKSVGVGGGGGGVVCILCNKQKVWYVCFIFQNKFKKTKRNEKKETRNKYNRIRNVHQKRIASVLQYSIDDIEIRKRSYAA